MDGSFNPNASRPQPLDSSKPCPDPAAAPPRIDSRPEVERNLDQLWNDFRRYKRPNRAQMDALLDGLLALPPNATDWHELYTEMVKNSHPDLHGVFRRIADGVSHSDVTSLGFFYWAAAETFHRRHLPRLLPEIVAGFLKLNRATYDVDAMEHLFDLLLANGLASEALVLYERFLPVMADDDNLVPGTVPSYSGVIFEMRVGQQIQADAAKGRDQESVATELVRGLGDVIHLDVARYTAAILVGPPPIPTWARDDFNLVKGDICEDDTAWNAHLQLFGRLIRIARHAWQEEEYPPACALRGLVQLNSSIQDQIGATRGVARRKLSFNLLDYLEPTGMEERVARACPGMIGTNVPKALLLLDAQGILLRFATKHRLLTAKDGIRTRAELRLLRAKLIDPPVHLPRLRLPPDFQVR